MSKKRFEKNLRLLGYEGRTEAILAEVGKICEQRRRQIKRTMPGCFVCDDPDPRLILCQVLRRRGL